MRISLACLSPVFVRTPRGNVLAPCGRCLACCIARQSALNFLCDKELQATYKKGLGASFVTLTYKDSDVPYVLDTPYQTLVKSDLQKFLKRLRYYVKDSNIPSPKFLACGEYGDSLGRPHFHLVFFGLSDYLAEQFVRSSWSFGLFQVGALSAGAIRYVLKYITKSRVDREIEQFYKSVGVQVPFVQHSQRLGHEWIFNHADEIVSNKYTFLYRGKRRLFPRAVRDLVYRITGVNPRDFVDEYLRSIHTNGESLDDFFARNTYNMSKNVYIKTIQDHSACSLPVSCRKPRELRSRPSWHIDYSDIDLD